MNLRLSCLLVSLVLRYIDGFSLLKTGTSHTTVNPLPSDISTVFVGGLKKPLNQEALRQSLERDYGKVSQITVVKEDSSNPYAFVTFDRCEDAQTAIEHRTNTPLLYQNIKPSTGNNNHDDGTENSKLQKKLGPGGVEKAREFERRLALARSTTVVLQVHRSHDERICEFLADTGGPDTAALPPSVAPTNLSVQIVRDPSSAVSLLLLEGISIHQIVDWLDYKLSFPLTGLNKVYSVDPDCVLSGGVSDILQHWTNIVLNLVNASDQDTDDKEPILRMEVFPPTLQTEVLAELQRDAARNAKKYSSLCSRLSPTQYTHSLTAVQLWSRDDCVDGRGGLYLTGLSEKSDSRTDQQRKRDSGNPMQAVDHEICRAYYKLQEAFYRYSRKYLLPTGSGKIAIDCGAAPGGWTQYLLDNDSHSTLSCSKIYSIDPGRLDPSLLSHPAVRHLPIKVEDALSLMELPRSGVDIWVSDMCLHQIEHQVDILLDAIDLGVVRSDTFFVITLKCNKGHSKSSFDRQVAEQILRLKSCTRDLLVIHLLSNRSGERTVMGYVG
ncbi:FtsJ-like methyltransferase [Seminavis robusta]|uniref:FtsJ-like methyltransferase n=1 Tax=Seminavis robusta TaxID=568900 RepID=A0A9N8E0U5_9STRA|nr:FtsJ-like methyltransferase [Seminavis robusta]|eukprot:Sro448_g145060.1 FtsJ-like methyltransferase (552) ;mRNA; r:7071-8726